MGHESTLDYRDPDWVANRLGIDKNSVYKYLAQGVLPGLRLGRKWLISEGTLVDFLKREEQHQTEGRRAMFGVEAEVAGEADVPLGLFSKRGRRVLGMARQEALGLNHDYAGSEHLLLGLVRETDGVAAKVLMNLGVLDKTLAALESTLRPGETPVPVDVGLPRGARNAIAKASDEARNLGHHYVGTEHLLLGVLQETEGSARRILESVGVSLEAARTEILNVLAAHEPAGRGSSSGLVGGPVAPVGSP